MWIRAALGVVLSALTVPHCDALYEHEAGRFDWKRMNVGSVQFASFNSKARKFFVGSKDGVVGAIGSSSGEAEWRQFMEADAAIDAIFQHRKWLLTVSDSGRYVRKWQATNGQLVWDTSYAGDNSLVNNEDTPFAALLGPNAFVSVSPTEGELLVFLGGVVHVMSVNDGSELWSYSPAQSDQFGNIVNANFSEDGNEVHIISITTVDGADHTVVAHLDVETGEVNESESTPMEDSIGSIAVCHIPQDSHYSEPVVVLMNEGGTNVVLQSRSAHASIAVDDIISGGSGMAGVSSLYVSGEEASPASSVLFSKSNGNRFLVQCENGLSLSQIRVKGEPEGVLPDNTLLAMMKPSESESSLAVTLASDEEHDTVTVNIVPTAVSGLDLQLQLEWDFLAHGAVETIFAYPLDRKDGSFAIRLLLISEDDAITCAQTSTDLASLRTMWVREEALAHVEHVDVIDWSGEETVLSRIPSLPERLALQAQSLKETVADFTELLLSPLAQQLEGEVVVSKDNIMFGFSKLILCLTDNGKLFALDSSDGHLVWSRFRMNKGVRAPDVGSVRVMITREKPFGDHAPEIAVIAREKTGMVVTWLNAYTGETNEETVFDGGVLSIAMLDEKFRDDSRRKLLGVTDAATKQLHILPENGVSAGNLVEIKAGLKDKFFFNIMDKVTQTMKGYVLQQPPKAAENAPLRALEVWALDFPVDSMTLISVTAPHPHEVISSSMDILGDDALMLKYLNPHLIVVMTSSFPVGNVGEKLNVYLIDTITGRILNSVSHAGGVAPAHAVVSENWVIYSFWNSKRQHTEIGVVALYENINIDKYDLNPVKTAPKVNNQFSSFYGTTPAVIRKSFIAPSSIKTLSSTVTAHGFSSKHVLIGMGSDQIMSMNRQVFNPRRPMTAPSPADKLEGLMPYHPHIPLSTTSIVSYNQTVPNLRLIRSFPAALESTSLVVGCGVDVFYTRVLPSKRFDLLAEDFNYFLLIVLLVAMFGAFLAVRHLDKRETLKAMWQ